MFDLWAQQFITLNTHSTTELTSVSETQLTRGIEAKMLVELGRIIAPRSSHTSWPWESFWQIDSQAFLSWSRHPAKTKLWPHEISIRSFRNMFADFCVKTSVHRKCQWFIIESEALDVTISYQSEMFYHIRWRTVNQTRTITRGASFRECFRT